MLPEIFLLVFCLVLPQLANGEGERELTETILLPKFKVNVKVHCRAMDGVGGSSFRHWILPNLVVVGGNNSGRDNPRNIMVRPGNFSLDIWRIGDDQLGDYLCHAEDTSGRPLYSRTSIVLHFAPVWETYRMNFIMSLSASGIFVVIATVFCVVSSFRLGRTSPGVLSDPPLPVKSNGAGPDGSSRGGGGGGGGGDLEPAGDMKVMTSAVVALPEVTTVKVVSPWMEEEKPDAEVEDDTAM